MPYCYACRNSKPATHAHFTDYGALAMRPPKRHISEIEAQWDTLSEEQRAQSLDIGRQILAAKASEELASDPPAPRAPRQRSASAASASPRPRAPRTDRAQEEEGEGIGLGGWLAIGAAAAGLLGAAWYGSSRTRTSHETPPQGAQDTRPASEMVRDILNRYGTPPQAPGSPDMGPQGA